MKNYPLNKSSHLIIYYQSKLYKLISLLPNMAKKETIGTLLAFLTAIISGFAIFIHKFFIIGLDPTIFTAVRAIIIGLVFLVLSLVFNSWGKKESKKLKWSYLLIIGIIGGGLAFLLYFSGLKLTTSGRTAFLHKTLPFYVLILAFFFLKEKITKKQLLAMLVMFVGIVVMYSASITPGELWLNPRTGDLLVMAATILWAVENTIAKKTMLEGTHNFVVSFARMFFGALFLFGVALLTNKLSLILTLTATQWFYILISTIILFFYIFTYYWAIRHINVSKAASILLISPVITLILGTTFLGEPAPALQLVGSALILIGAYFIATVKSEFARI